jgi:hypothetical protein
MIGAEIAVLSWNNFYCQGTTALFHNQETAPLRMSQTEFSLSFYAKIFAEIAVLSWNHVYCQGTTALFHNQEMHLCPSARLSSRSLGKIGAEIAVLSWKNFSCQGTTALFHNQESALLRMRQNELSLSCQDRC